MRVIIDLQACQSGSRYRGIGRYSMSLARAMVHTLLSNGHEVIVALSAVFHEEANLVEAELERLSPDIRFVRFSILSPCAAADSGNAWRQMASRLLREHFIAALQPDVVHVATLLADGWLDDAVASVGTFPKIKVPTVLTHYDLIPLVMSDIYMPSDSPFKSYYIEKLKSVGRADLLLAISEYSRKEALELLALRAESVVNISSAVNDDFAVSSGKDRDSQSVLDKHGIPVDFLLYAPGGFDARKNINCLLEAYALLSTEVRTRHRLVIASKVDDELRKGLIWKAGTFGIASDDLIITGYLPDDELIDLYRTCGAYVFPSLHEGFGLPVLEAMSCGAVVIASNSTSIPEAHGLEEALFDPSDPSSIASKMMSALTDEAFRIRLRMHATRQLARFSWAHSANVACNAMEDLHERLIHTGWRKDQAADLPSEGEMLEHLSGMNLAALPNAMDLEKFSDCLNLNLRGLQ